MTPLEWRYLLIANSKQAYEPKIEYDLPPAVFAHPLPPQATECGASGSSRRLTVTATIVLAHRHRQGISTGGKTGRGKACSLRQDRRA